jgi:hypothetical protein
VANSPKRFCGDPCKQQASILRRAAALLIDLGKDQAWSVLEKLREVRVNYQSKSGEADWSDDPAERAGPSG